MSMRSVSTQDGFAQDTPFSTESTVVASPSSWKETLTPSNHPAQPTSKQLYLDVPSFRPSLDSTYSDLSELSFHSNELQNQHPLVRNISHNAAASGSNGRHQPSRFRAAWDSFYETNYGALLVLASQGFGVGMNICARLLETPGSHGKPMHPFQILFARQSVTALICTAYGLYTKAIPDFPFGQRGIRWLLVLRGITGFFGVFGMYFSLLYLPLSEATVLGFLSPILTCYLCSFIMSGETFTAQQQIAAFVSLIGVLFIAHPASLFSLSTTSTQPSTAAMNPPANSTITADPSQHVTPEQHLAAVGIAMIGVIGATGALTSIRVIGTRVHAFISINYFSVWCSIVSLTCLVIFPDVKFRLPGNLTEWSLLTSLGLCGFVMQFLLTAGLAYGGPGQDQADHQRGRKVHDLESTGSRRTKPKASGTRAMAMCYTQMLFALAGDKLVFGVTPDTMSWIGSVLILAGAVWVAAVRESATDNKDLVCSRERRSGTGVHSGLGLLRGQGRAKGQANREEAVGLMTGDDVDDANEHDDEDVVHAERRDEHEQGLESFEMHELRPDTGGN